MLGQFRIVKITNRDARSADVDFTWNPKGNRLSAFVEQVNGRVRNRAADGDRFPHGLVRIVKERSGEGRGFRRAIAIQELQLRAGLGDRSEGRGRNFFPASKQVTEVAERIRLLAGKFIEQRSGEPECGNPVGGNFPSKFRGGQGDFRVNDGHGPAV